MVSAIFHIIFEKSYSCYTCLVEMSHASVDIFSLRLEMSEYRIHNDYIVVSTAIVVAGGGGRCR